MTTLPSDHLFKLTEQYNMLKDFHERRSFYHQQLYPALRDTFASEPASDVPIELLLLPVSNEHLPVLAAARWKPRIAFGLYSYESRKHRTRIEEDIRALNLGILCAGEEIPNIEIDPNTLYRVVRRAIRPYLRTGQKYNPHIAVDFTGGTKVMSVASAMAVSVVGGRFFYVLSAAARDDIQQRAVGTEQPRLLEDPYTVFGDLEAAEAQRLYGAYDYAGAQRIYADLANRVAGQDGERYGALATLAAMYAAWDTLRFAEAAQHANALLLLTTPKLLAHRHVLEHQRHVVHTLATVSAAVSSTSTETKIHTLADPAALLPLLGTLHTAAVRRAAQGRYDFAALFRYRCLELISQHRLATYGIFTNGPQFDALGANKAQVNDAFMACQRALGRTAPRGLGKLRSIAMFDGYMLLAALDDPLVRGYDLTQIEERTKARNQSVLAHGYRLIDVQEYTAFAAVVDEVIDRLFRQVVKQPRPEWETMMQFVEPF